MPQYLKYPVITKVSKAAAGAWKNDVYICNNPLELKYAWSKIKTDEIIVQEYIEKKNELSIFGISINQGEEIECLCAVEYIRMSEKGYGFYMRAIPVRDNALKIKIQSILAEMKFTGVWGLECLVDKNNDLYFLEVNMRNDAFAYVSTKYGFNLPYEWAKATIEGHISIDWQRLKDGTFTAMVSGPDMKQIIRYKVSAVKWLWQYLTIDCLLDGDKKCPWILYALAKAFSMGWLKMFLKSVFKLYKKEDYPYAF